MSEKAAGHQVRWFGSLFMKGHLLLEKFAGLVISDRACAEASSSTSASQGILLTTTVHACRTTAFRQARSLLLYLRTATTCPPCARWSAI